MIKPRWNVTRILTAILERILEAVLRRILGPKRSQYFS
jgi:hypothetical protein